MFVAANYLLYDPAAFVDSSSSDSAAMSPSMKSTFSIAKLLQERETRSILSCREPGLVMRPKKATCVVVTRQRTPSPSDPQKEIRANSPSATQKGTCVPSRDLKFGVERILSDRLLPVAKTTEGRDSERFSSVDQCGSLCPSFVPFGVNSYELSSKLTAPYPSPSPPQCHCPAAYFAAPNYNEDAAQFVFDPREAAQFVLSTSRLCHPAAMPISHQVPHIYTQVYSTNVAPQSHVDSRQLQSNIIPGFETNATGKRKRSWSRAVFSNLQRKGLEKRFVIQKYITKPDRRQLAATLGLTDAQVKVWFQNRRMKWRHSKEYREELAKTGNHAANPGSEGSVTGTQCDTDMTRAEGDELNSKRSKCADSGANNKTSGNIAGDKSQIRGAEFNKETVGVSPPR